MPDNRSLDEFLGGEPAEAEGAEAATEDAPPEPADDAGPESDEDPPAGPDPEAAEDEPVEPMTVTVAWSAEGGDCESCGAAVEERWRDGDAMVCGDCKAW